MLQPTWLVDGLAGVMVAVSIYCVARLVAARRWGRTLHRDVNVAHVAMGVGMAGMLDASLPCGSPPAPPGSWPGRASDPSAATPPITSPTT
jgi:hypothetical protein